MPNSWGGMINQELANQYMRAVGIVIKLAHIIEHNNIAYADDSIKEAKLFINQNDRFYRLAIESFTEQPNNRLNHTDTPLNNDDFI